jgi:uncharacterized small protein (TIGR04563 family)
VAPNKLKTSAGPDKRKQSLYFLDDMLAEIQAEASRQDRSLSWIVQQAWRLSRHEIKRFPRVADLVEKAAEQAEQVPPLL